ncbi:MAG: RNA polymerase sigma factor [Myxococcales bacterium]|nr:RNA polymerase sigma factor [Myxococcales bacterium]
MMAARIEESPGGSDHRLMKRVAEGDSHAQRVLAHRLAPRVLRLARRLLGGSVDAEDASQVAMLEILRSAHTYADRARIERWADRITVRVVLHHAKQRRRPWLMGSVFDVDSLAEAPVPTVREQTPRSVEAYLSELPADRREVLVLKHGLGYTTEEVAQLLDRPTGTVKDQLVSARRQVRKIIQRELRFGAGGQRDG